MKNLKERERAAIDAVARRFSARSEQAGDSAAAYLVVAGKRVAVDITTLKRRVTGHTHAGAPGLRFDKVATRLVERLHVTIGEALPDGMTVLLTITAPIRLPSKTAASLEDKIRTLLGRGLARRGENDTIHGNRVRVQLLRGESKRARRVIGFVHNPDSDPLLLLNITREWLELIGAASGRRTPKPAGDRWLVVVSPAGSSWLAAYRFIYSQLRPATNFKQILVVFGDGRVETLTG